MTNDVPTPVWNSATGSWEPVDRRDGQRVTQWPDGFDPGCLPQPEYQEGEHVQFVRDETCAREGRVRRVLLTPHPGACPAKGQGAWYLDASQVVPFKDNMSLEATTPPRKQRKGDTTSFSSLTETTFLPR